jgi:hypothetical protein
MEKYIHTMYKNNNIYHLYIHNNGEILRERELQKGIQNK